MKRETKKEREKVIRRELRDTGECYRGQIAVLRCEDTTDVGVDYKISPRYDIDADEDCFFNTLKAAIRRLLMEEDFLADDPNRHCTNCAASKDSDDPCYGSEGQPCYRYHVVPGCNAPKPIKVPDDPSKPESERDHMERDTIEMMQMYGYALKLRKDHGPKGVTLSFECETNGSYVHRFITIK